MTCNNCTWFVDDDVIEPGDYQHEIAVRNQKGFCLLQDLFTMVEPDNPACDDFNSDGASKNEKNNG